MECNYTPLRWAVHGKAAHLPGRDHFGLPYRSWLFAWPEETLKSMCGFVQNQSSMQVVSQPSPPHIQCVHGESPSRTNAHATSAILQCSGGRPGSDFAEGCWATDLPM